MSVLCQVVPPVALQSQLKTNSKKTNYYKTFRRNFRDSFKN